MRYFFTADLHLWHRKIIELAGRPYTSVEEHNAYLQEAINTAVSPNDTLVILGDVAFGSWKRLATWFDGLRTDKLCLVYGNHDDTVKKLVKHEPERFRRVGDVLEFKIPRGDEQIVLWCAHYAHRVWNKSHHGSYHLYGHSHNTLPDNGTRSMDVGVDTNGYCPWSLEDILAKLEPRKLAAVDHHQPDLKKLSGNTICALCGIKLCYHETNTLNCPQTGTTGVAIQYHPTQYFCPKRA